MHDLTMEGAANKHTKAERDVAKLVYENFVTARNSRQNSCYWDSAQSGEITDASGSGGGNWNARWDLQDKIYLMHQEKPAVDDFESNVKSPMATGRIESTVQKLRKVNVQFAIRPEDSDDPADVRKARIVQELVNSLFLKGKFKHKLVSWYKDTLIHGAGFLQVYYLRKQRTVQIPITDAKNLDKKQKKDLKAGKRIYKEDVVFEYDDIAIEPVKINEVYPDPSARYLHGESYEAQWVIRRMLPSFAQFKAMFDGDPDAKNISKVKPAQYYSDVETEFFEPPKDVDTNDYVQLLHYWDKREDRYIVMANDIIIKDIPLPYMHKQIPIVQATAIEIPHQLYGAGIPDRLMVIQAEEEILKNLTYDRLHISANPMQKVKKNVYGEVSKMYAQAVPGAMIPVTSPDDIEPIEFPAMSFDMFRAIDNLNRDAVLATQIDPIQMGVMQRYVSATTSMLTKEQMDSFINGLVDAFSEPMSTLGYQIVALMKQFYTAPKVEEKLGKPRSKRVRLQGIEINPDTFEIVKKKSDEYSSLEVKPEYFEISGDWDITVSPESMEVNSRAIEMQKAQANLAQLAPFMVNPADTRSVMQNPAPWIDGPKTLRWYCETNGVPMDLLVTDHEDDDIAMKRAEEQGKKMLKGEEIPGMPGESDAHKKVHVQQLNAQNKKVMELEMQIGQLGTYAPAYIGMMPEMQQLEMEKGLSQMLAMHLQIDDMPAALSEEAATQRTQMQTQPQVPMPPGLNQATGGTPETPTTPGEAIPGGAGMESSSPEGQKGGPEGRSGRPTMAEAGMPI